MAWQTRRTSSVSARPTGTSSRARAGARGPDAPGRVQTRPGGVALNVAAGLAARGLRVSLAAAVGDDAEGRALAEWLRGAGVSPALLMVYENVATGRYVAIERPDGELLAAVADTLALDSILPEHLPLNPAPAADAWLIDANLPAPAIRRLACEPGRPLLMADAASEAKADRLRPILNQLDVIYCNRAEAEAICATGLNAARAAAEALCARGARRAVVTNGPLPAADAGPHGCVTLRPDPSPIRSVTGAGDALIAAHVAALMTGARPDEALAAGLAAARAQAA
ncbi:MAG: PfkB family carbohydrate kinase [Rubrimonas sp.]